MSCIKDSTHSQEHRALVHTVSTSSLAGESLDLVNLTRGLGLVQLQKYKGWATIFSITLLLYQLFIILVVYFFFLFFLNSTCANYCSVIKIQKIIWTTYIKTNNVGSSLTWGQQSAGSSSEDNTRQTWTKENGARKHLVHKSRGIILHQTKIIRKSGNGTWDLLIRRQRYHQDAGHITVL